MLLIRPRGLTSLLVLVLFTGLILSIGTFVFVMSPTSPTDPEWNLVPALLVAQPFLLASYLLAARGLWVREAAPQQAVQWALSGLFVLFPGLFLVGLGLVLA